MKYKILNKAIKINNYSYDNNVFNANISLMSYAKEVFTSNIAIYPTFNDIFNDLNSTVLQFKKTDGYLKNLNISNINSNTLTKLGQEYNVLNNINELLYFLDYVPDLTEADYSTQFIKRNIVKFLNHDVVLDVSDKDYSDIVNKNENTHFEAYDENQISWMISGDEDKVLEYNTNSLKLLTEQFGPLNFYFNQLDNNNIRPDNPRYLTEFIEINNLYTVGLELVDADSLANYSGYYHYFKGRLLTGMDNSKISDGNKKLLEITNDQFLDETISDDMINAANDIQVQLQNIDALFGQLSDTLDSLESSAVNIADEAKDNILKEINNVIDNLGDDELASSLKQDLEDTMKLMDASGDDATFDMAVDEIQEKNNNAFDKTAEAAMDDPDLEMSEKDKKKMKKLLKKVKKKKIKLPKTKGHGLLALKKGALPHAHHVGF